MTELADITLAPIATPGCRALIAGAGTGSRTGAVGPKPDQPIAGRPMVMQSLAAFAELPRSDQALALVSRLLHDQPVNPCA